MKNIALLLILLSLGLLQPVRAQTAPDAGAVPDQATPALPRNIMPTSLNHKPNATKPPAEIAGPIDKFFNGLKAGDYVNAYDTFLSGTDLGKQTDKKSVFISKTQDATALYGKLNDYEIFDNYSVGSNILVLTYLTRHRIQPLRWRFIYYRPGVDDTGKPSNSWNLINMGFDDVLLEMLD